MVNISIVITYVVNLYYLSCLSFGLGPEIGELQKSYLLYSNIKTFTTSLLYNYNGSFCVSVKTGYLEC